MSAAAAPPPRGAGEPVEGFLLAGGRSRRMGRDKALLELGGRAVIERVAAAMLPVVARLRLVASDPAPYARLGLESIPDRWPDAAALGGIGTAVAAASPARALVLACDLPFVVPALLGFLVGLEPSADVTLPETDERGAHPLCAVYSARCLGPIARRVEAGELKVVGFFPDVRVRRVPERELRAAGFGPELLANLNTPEDYERARSRRRP